MPHAPARSDRLDEVARTDRNWLIVTVVVFVVTIALLAAVYQLYQATRPHPHILHLLRKLTALARRLLPGY